MRTAALRVERRRDERYAAGCDCRRAAHVSP
jgi:hypothetical protein